MSLATKDYDSYNYQFHVHTMWANSNVSSVLPATISYLDDSPLIYAP